MRAREIAENRLAEGEITEEEFDRIISKIEQSESANRRHSDRRPPPEYRSQERDRRPPDDRVYLNHGDDIYVRGETNRQRPAPERVESGASDSSGFGAAGKILSTVFGLYFASCILFALMGVGDKAAEKLYTVCTNRDHPFCKCQARGAKSQLSFFKAPLVLFRIVSLKSNSDACRHLK